MKPTALELENWTRPDALDLKGFPEEARKEIEQTRAEGVPTAIGTHPDIGLFAICTAGQGPMILWTER